MVFNGQGLDPLENSTTPRLNHHFLQKLICLDPLENSTTPRLFFPITKSWFGLDPLENSTTPRQHQVP